MSRLCNYVVKAHMLDENCRRGERVVFSSEQTKKMREVQVKVKVKFTLKQVTKPQSGS
jgi:polyisoprenoid-binding protein YceI